MKFLALLVPALALVFAQQGQLREANLDIRFEPTAKLQTQVPVPFQITVRDSLNKPFIQGKVTLQIETTEHRNVKVFNAPMTAPGIYIAKPVFPEAGEYNVYVEVRRDDRMSARTIQFSVAQ